MKKTRKVWREEGKLKAGGNLFIFDDDTLREVVGRFAYSDCDF